MSTEEILNNVQQLPLSEKIIVMEELLQSIKSDAIALSTSSEESLSEIKRRRKAFEIKTFDLGEDVEIDRDEMYSQRGL